MFLHVEFKKKSYKSNYKQVDKSNIFVSVSTLKILRWSYLGFEQLFHIYVIFMRENGDIDKKG